MTNGAILLSDPTTKVTSAITNTTKTAAIGLPDLVVPFLQNASTGPNRSSSANAFNTLEAPIIVANSPENVAATIPIGKNGAQKLSG